MSETEETKPNGFVPKIVPTGVQQVELTEIEVVARMVRAVHNAGSASKREAAIEEFRQLLNAYVSTAIRANTFQVRRQIFHESNKGLCLHEWLVGNDTPGAPSHKCGLPGGHEGHHLCAAGDAQLDQPGVECPASE